MRLDLTGYDLAVVPDSVVRPEEGKKRGELAGVL